MFADSPFVSDQTITGQILEILCDTVDKSITVVLLDLFELVSERHSIFGMPVLARAFGERKIVALSGLVSHNFFKHLRTFFLTSSLFIQSVLFNYNVQHDCLTGKCSTSGQEPVMHERVDSGTTRDVILHSNLAQYVVNMHALHNAHLLREVMPRRLVEPIPIHADRQSYHRQRAATLRATQTAQDDPPAATEASPARDIDHGSIPNAAAPAPLPSDDELPQNTTAKQQRGRKRARGA